MKKSLLFYNLYPKKNWKEITSTLLSIVPHDDIIIHVSIPLLSLFHKKEIIDELNKYPKTKQILFSRNRKKLGETVGFEKLKTKVDLEPYDILTYIHSKGSSKSGKNTQPIKDWTELMRYFVVERLDLTKNAFNKGYYLYGVNLSENMHPSPQDKTDHPDTQFIYEGNFVSINLNMLSSKLLSTPCRQNYYGLERYWGRLCTIDRALSAHQSTVDHYNETYSAEFYTDNN